MRNRQTEDDGSKTLNGEASDSSEGADTPVWTQRVDPAAGAAGMAACSLCGWFGWPCCSRLVGQIAESCAIPLGRVYIRHVA